jgi:hypothetical protein
MDGTDVTSSNGGRGTGGGLAWLMGQMFLIPLRTLVYGMEMFVDTMREMQKTSNRGMDVIVGGDTVEAQDEPSACLPPLAANFSNTASLGGTQTSEETNEMMDKDLNDDKLKLVRFKILFVKREYEHAFEEQEDLIADNIDGSAFTAWKVAEFIQKLDRGRREDEPDKIRLPHKWKRKPYPREDCYRQGDFLLGFPEDDKKYLRVYYEVLERYEREKFKHDEREVEVLEDIHRTLQQKL